MAEIACELGWAKAFEETRAEEIAYGTEQDRLDILKRREDWFESQLDLDPERLVFLDETWAKLARGRAKR